METREQRLKYWRDYYKTHKHICLDCGKTISNRGIRCVSCSTRHSWKTGILNAQNLARGGKHGQWGGGRYTGPSGYIFVLCPDHPRADNKGYIREHILIWEQSHNQSVPKGWVIHHLNGIRHDNRPENLVALPDKKHKHVFAAKAKRIQELEALLNNQKQLL